jgi:peptide/nickel transport system ATP-binding protein
MSTETNPDAPLLEVENLHVQFDTYDGRAEVLNGIDLTIETGETAALVGETGCGKSVTAKTILGLLSDNAIIPEGEVRFKGRDLLELSEKERHALRGADMTLIMQDPMSALNPVFTVGDQMIDMLRYQGQRRLGVTQWIRDKFRSDEALRERAIEMLERVQLSAPERVFESYPVELSGGMRQRVLIAMALLSEPDFLIADEPGTALDVTTEERILELMNDLIRETDAAVMYITHDLGVAKKVSNHTNVMYAGEIVESAPSDRVFSEPLHPYSRGLIDSIPTLSGDMGSGMDGQIPDYTNPPTGCRFADRCPHAEDACSEVPPYQRETGPDHGVACHLYDGPGMQSRHNELVASEDVDIGDPPWWMESPSIGTESGTSEERATSTTRDDTNE